MARCHQTPSHYLIEPTLTYHQWISVAATTRHHRQLQRHRHRNRHRHHCHRHHRLVYTGFNWWRGSSLTALISAPLQVFLLDGWVSVRPIVRQYMWITSVQVFLYRATTATTYRIEFLDFLQPTIAMLHLLSFKNTHVKSFSYPPEANELKWSLHIQVHFAGTGAIWKLHQWSNPEIYGLKKPVPNCNSV